MKYQIYNEDKTVNYGRVNGKKSADMIIRQAKEKGLFLIAVKRRAVGWDLV